MLKMFHYMKERWHYIVMIILLLFVQAFCDLSLPDYTSKIVNVGPLNRKIWKHCCCLWSRRNRIRY